MEENKILGTEKNIEESGKDDRSAKIKKIFSIIAFIMAMILIVSIPVAAWFMTEKKLAAYAPISSPQSLYIGAGHIHFAVDPDDTDEYEDVRYLYLDGIDVDEEGIDYYDYVFCVYGKAIGSFKLQLAYTTNNQFTYEIFYATESTETSPGAVAYTTHGETPSTYYYSIDSSNSSPIAGRFLNDNNNDPDPPNGLADNTMHTDTYGSYNNVNKYAEPIYWQTSDAIRGSIRREAFVRYFILRVNINGKTTNDRETDVICIAAKSTS
ncbi:MAG: hypothetical protein IKP68_08545 [Clostridia bacterium]|nr:hypothetical protein [Clostridia bacterium]